MSLHALKRLNDRFPITRPLFYPALVLRRHLNGKRQLAHRQIIENLRELIVEDPVMHVAELEGVFAVDPKSDLFSRLIVSRSYEPRLVELCKQLLDPQKDVVDVGANIGFYSVMFARQLQQGKVLAVEPTQRALERLRRNLNMNDIERKVCIFAGVLSNCPGTAEIKTISGREEYSTILAMEHPSVAGFQFESYEVESITLDALVLREQLNPGFIKVDVEGAEHLVFDGASKTLAEHRPIILSELCNYLLIKNGSSSADVIARIESYDYVVLNPREAGATAVAEEFGEVLCTPRESLDRVVEILRQVS